MEPKRLSPEPKRLSKLSDGTTGVAPLIMLDPLAALVVRSGGGSADAS